MEKYQENMARRYKNDNYKKMIYSLRNVELVNGQTKYFFNFSGTRTGEIEYFETTSTEFEQQLYSFYETEFCTEMEYSAGRQIAFDEIFCFENKIEMHTNDMIFLIHLFLFHFQKHGICTIFPYRNYCLVLNWKDKIWSLIQEYGTKVFSISFEKNIFHKLYTFFLQSIHVYEKLSEEQKLKMLFQKYKVRLDFTKKNYSYAFDSHHIVMTQKADKGQILYFLTHASQKAIEALLYYFSVFCINDSLYKRFRDFKKQEKIFCDYVNKINHSYLHSNIYMEEPSIHMALKSMRPASSRKIIDKIKNLDMINIRKVTKDGKIYYYFSLDKSRYITRYNVLLYMICSGYTIRGMFRYNYTNSHFIL